MAKSFAAWWAVLLAPLALVAQTPTSIVTRPLEPSGKDFDRLNLTVAWRVYLPVDNAGDGIAVVQPDDDQVFVQLKSGTLIVIQAHADARTFRKPGDIVWTYRPAKYNGVIYPVAFSPVKSERKTSDKLVQVREVYLVQGHRLIVLDRADGKVKYTETMSSTACAGPTADEANIYIPLSNRRLIAFSHVAKVEGYLPPKAIEFPDPIKKVDLGTQAASELSTPSNRSPSITVLETLRPPFRRSSDYIDSSVSLAGLKNVLPPYRAYDGNRTPSVGFLPNLRDVYEQASKSAPTRLHFEWELLTPGLLSDTPLLTKDADDPASARLITYSGRELFTTFPDGLRINRIATEHITEANVSAGLSNHGDMVYVATADSNILSFSMKELREPSLARNSLPRGIFTTGGPITQTPVLVEDSLYVVGERWGMMRVKKGTLDPMWTERLPDGRFKPKPNASVGRVLAVNAEYVYAQDRKGNLVILDAKRGDTLSSFDISSFNVPVTNYENDRLYLAAHNGLLICARDKARLKPELLRPSLKKAPPKKDAEPKMEPKKDPEAKKDPEPKKDDPEPKKDEKKD